MIPAEVEQQVRRLLAAGHSQHTAAKLAGVARGTVADIAHRPAERDAQREAESPPPERCPICGHLVQMPCLACRLKSLQRGRRLRRVYTGPEDPAALGLDLPQDAAEPPAGPALSNRVVRAILGRARECLAYHPLGALPEHEPVEPPRDGEGDLDLTGARARYEAIRDHRARTGRPWQPPGT